MPAYFPLSVTARASHATASAPWGQERKLQEGRNIRHGHCVQNATHSLKQRQSCCKMECREQPTATQSYKLKQFHWTSTQNNMENTIVAIGGRPRALRKNSNGTANNTSKLATKKSDVRSSTVDTRERRVTMYSRQDRVETGYITLNWWSSTPVSPQQQKSERSAVTR